MISTILLFPDNIKTVYLEPCILLSQQLPFPKQFTVVMLVGLVWIKLYPKTHFSVSFIFSDTILPLSTRCQKSPFPISKVKKYVVCGKTE